MNSTEKLPLPSAGEGWGEGIAPQVVRHKNSTIKARNLRKEQTDAEGKFWNEVKAKRFLGLKFKRQHPIGPYFPDFVCLEEKIVVEIDGGQHCENKKDETRTRFLENEGFKVIRFWNNEVLENMEGLLSSLSLTLSRKRERESDGEIK